MKTFIENKIYSQVHDKKIPVRYMGREKIKVIDAENVQLFQFQEVITKQNKNWCNGDTFWTRGNCIINK